MSYMYGLLGLLLRILQVTRFYLFAFLIALYTSFIMADYFIEDVSVYENDGVYYINIASEIDASEHYVRSVLTDYDHIYRLSDSIIVSKIINKPDDEKIQIETLVLSCVPGFCMEVTRVDEVSELETGEIQAVIIPEKSDFRSGLATWKIETTGSTTRLTYEATIEPDFFIPPAIGTQMVIDSLRKEFSATINHIQHIARIYEKNEWENDFEFSNAIKHPKEEPCDTDLISSFQ
jgi:hypothetical protein